MTEAATQPPGARSALLGRCAVLAPLVLVTAFWGAVLFRGLAGRAFDPSDPTEEISDSMGAADGFLRGGVVGWMSRALSNPNAKPVLYGMLSLGYLCGLPGGHEGYKIMAGTMVLLQSWLLLAVVLRRSGAWAALLAAVLVMSSDSLMGYALWGGSIWAGQLFLWAAALLACGRWGEAALRPRESFLLGLLLSSSCLASYVMPAHMAGLLALWAAAGIRAQSPERRLGQLARSAAALAGGLLAVPLGMELLTFGADKPHIWTTVASRVSYAIDQNLIRGGAAALLPDFLRSSESVAFLAALGLGVAVDAAACARAAKDGRDRAEPLFVAAPAAALAFMALGSSPRLGRILLPMIPFLIASAASGLARALERLPQGAPRRTAALAACAAVLGCSMPRHARTLRAFHAGDGLRSAMERGRGAGSAGGPLIVVGYSVPFQYLPGAERRVGSMAELRAAASTGEEWVLASRYSNWFRRGFKDETEAGTVPIDKAFSSDRPFIASPGVESLPFQAFTNSDLYARFRSGRTPFPVDNRLYRAREFLAACSDGSPASPLVSAP